MFCKSMEVKNIESNANDGGLVCGVSEGSTKTLLGSFAILSEREKIFASYTSIRGLIIEYTRKNFFKKTNLSKNGLQIKTRNSQMITNDEKTAFKSAQHL